MYSSLNIGHRQRERDTDTDRERDSSSSHESLGPWPWLRSGILVALCTENILILAAMFAITYFPPYSDDSIALSFILALVSCINMWLVFGIGRNQPGIIWLGCFMLFVCLAVSALATVTRYTMDYKRPSMLLWLFVEPLVKIIICMLYFISIDVYLEALTQDWFRLSASNSGSSSDSDRETGIEQNHFVYVLPATATPTPTLAPTPTPTPTAIAIGTSYDNLFN